MDANEASNEGSGASLELFLCSLQAVEEEVHVELHLRAVLQVGRAEEVRQGAQGVWGKQCEQDPGRGPRGAAGGHGEFARLRG